MKRISRNLTTIYRTEHLIARRRFAVMRKQTLLMALAGIAALAGLTLLNVSFFFFLETRVSPAGAAAILAAANLALAGILVAVAGRSNVEDEIASAIELRDMAIADIEEELDDVAAEARDVVQTIKGVSANPLGSLATLLVPLLTAVLKKQRD